MVGISVPLVVHTDHVQSYRIPLLPLQPTEGHSDGGEHAPIPHKQKQLNSFINVTELGFEHSTFLLGDVRLTQSFSAAKKIYAPNTQLFPYCWEGLFLILDARADLGISRG